MRRLLSAVCVVLLLATTVAGVGAAAGADRPAVDAGQLEQQNGTATAAETATEQEQEGNTTVVAQVDDAVRVTGYSYDAEKGMFTVSLQNTGDVKTTVTITEVISRRQAGAGSFGIGVIEVAPGETVDAQVSAARVRGTAAVMVLTQKSILQGSGTYLQESQRTNTNLIRGGSSGADVRAAYTGGALLAVVGIILGGWQYLASSNQGVRPADVAPKTNLLGRFRE